MGHLEIMSVMAATASAIQTLCIKRSQVKRVKYPMVSALVYSYAHKEAASKNNKRIHVERRKGGSWQCKQEAMDIQHLLAGWRLRLLAFGSYVSALLVIIAVESFAIRQR